MLLDIGVGILVAILTAGVFKITLSLQLVVFCIVFAGLLDVDFFIWWIFKSKKDGHHNAHFHRDILHYPLIFLPLGSLVMLVFGSIWAFAFFVSSFLHLLHDSIGIGWGIKWLYPFSRKSYKFFSDKTGVVFSKNFLVNWENGELNEAVEKYGERNWFSKYYLSFHPLGLIEAGVFIVSLLALFFVLR